MDRDTNNMAEAKANCSVHVQWKEQSGPYHEGMDSMPC